jgi:hypothetical protein
MSMRRPRVQGEGRPTIEKWGYGVCNQSETKRRDSVECRRNRAPLAVKATIDIKRISAAGCLIQPLTAIILRKKEKKPPPDVTVNDREYPSSINGDNFSWGGD